MSIISIGGMYALCLAGKSRSYQHTLWQSTTPSPLKVPVSLQYVNDQTLLREKTLWDVGSGKFLLVQSMFAQTADTKWYDHV
jgi:hypothetical protein